MNDLFYLIEDIILLILGMIEQPIFILFMLFVLFCSSVISFTVWLLGRFGQMKMLKNLGYKSPFHAFIPYAAAYSFGWLASQYDNGKKAKKHSKLYLVAKLLILFTSAMTAVFAVGFLAVIEMNRYSNDNTAAYIFFFLMMGTIFLCALLKAVTFVYNYVLSYNVFMIFANKSGKLLIALCLISRFLLNTEITPAFYFFLRKKYPTVLRSDCPMYSFYAQGEKKDAPVPQYQGYNPQYGAMGQYQGQYQGHFNPPPMPYYQRSGANLYPPPAVNCSNGVQEAPPPPPQAPEINHKLYVNAQSVFDDYIGSEG